MRSAVCGLRLPSATLPHHIVGVLSVPGFASMHRKKGKWSWSGERQHVCRCKSEHVCKMSTRTRVRIWSGPKGSFMSSQISGPDEM